MSRNAMYAKFVLLVLVLGAFAMFLGAASRGAAELSRRCPVRLHRTRAPSPRGSELPRRSHMSRNAMYAKFVLLMLRPRHGRDVPRRRAVGAELSRRRGRRGASAPARCTLGA